MLLGWERDRKENDWQAILWRTLAGEGEPLHLARMRESLGERDGFGAAREPLPERVSIFGVSSLPPFYLRVFIELSRHCEVNFFSARSVAGVSRTGSFAKNEGESLRKQPADRGRDGLRR